MASKGSLRLMNEQIKDICEKMAAHEELAQAALYAQYKNACILSLTPYYRGDAADAFKRYLEHGTMNLIKGFLHISSEMTLVARQIQDAFMQYESDQSGAVAESALEYISNELDSKRQVFIAATDDLEATANLARQYIAVKDLELQTVIDAFIVIREAVDTMRADLHSCDDSLLDKVSHLYDEIAHIKAQTEELIGFCYSGGVLDISKAVEISSQSWHTAENNVTFALLLYADSFANEMRMMSEPERLAFAKSIEAKKAEAYALVKKEVDMLMKNSDGIISLSEMERQGIVNFISEEYRGQGIEDISEEARDLLIKGYELNHPENTRKINDFLRKVALDKNHQEDVYNIKYLAYASPEPYHSILFEYLPEITLNSYRGDARCFFGVMSIDLGTDSKTGIGDSRGGYATFFHELGHGIDYAMSKPEKNGIDIGIAGAAGVANAVYDGISILIRPDMSYKLKDHIAFDVENGIRREIHSVAGFDEPLSEKEQATVDVVFDSLMRGGKPLADDELNGIRTEVQEIFGRYEDAESFARYSVNENGIIYGHNNNGASDVYSGFTGYNIMGLYGHQRFEKDVSCFKDILAAAGVDESITIALPNSVGYWSLFDPSLEFFADSFSANVTQYSEPLASLERHLPSATAAFHELMENVMQGGTE